MKKLLILAVLALGLCASPALAETIDFSQVTLDISYLRGSNEDPHWSHQFAGSDEMFDIYLEHYDWQDGSTGWTTSADGITKNFLYDNENFRLTFRKGQNGVPDELPYDFIYDFITVDGVSIDLRWDGLLTFVYGGYNEKGEGFHETLQVANDGSLYTLNLASVGYIRFVNEDEIPQSYCPLDVTLSSLTYNPRASNPVPVPAAVWLLGTGVAGVAALRRKFK